MKINGLFEKLKVICVSLVVYRLDLSVTRYGRCGSLALVRIAASNPA